MCGSEPQPIEHPSSPLFLRLPDAAAGAAAGDTTGSPTTPGDDVDESLGDDLGEEAPFVNGSAGRCVDRAAGSGAEDEALDEASMAAAGTAPMPLGAPARHVYVSVYAYVYVGGR